MTTNTTEKPGCLSIVMKYLGLTKSQDTSRQAKVSVSTMSADWSDTDVSESLPYRLRDDFLSPAELSFYRVLTTLVGARLSIQSKVRLADIFFVARPNENPGYFNRIAQRHLDFLVCDLANMKPLFGIELDDASHKRSNRQERDEIVDRIFEVANLPLVRVPPKRAYSASEIGELVAPYIENIDSDAGPPAQIEESNQASTTVICPKCGIPMVVRTVSKGDHKGKQFYGCQNFPRCREMKPISQ